MKSSPTSVTILATGWQANRSSPKNTGRNGASRTLCFSNQPLTALCTSENRARYERDELRYVSDVTNVEWALIESLIPGAKRGGRRRNIDMRQTCNAVIRIC